MTKTDTVNASWDREINRLPRRADGRRELRQFHTAEGTATPSDARGSGLSKASTIALAVGNGAVMGALLGSLFGTASGVVTGVVVSLVGYGWISSQESKGK